MLVEDAVAAAFDIDVVELVVEKDLAPVLNPKPHLSLRIRISCPRP